MTEAAAHAAAATTAAVKRIAAAAVVVHASAAGLVLREHRVRVGLALSGVRRRDRVDDALRFLVADFCKNIKMMGLVIWQPDAKRGTREGARPERTCGCEGAAQGMAGTRACM
jgi:hypothetical protein